MELRWPQLKEEATTLAHEIGQSGREHHPIVKDQELLSAIRTQGIPAEHREWVWPILLHAQNQKLQRQSSAFLSYNQLLGGYQEGELEQQQQQQQQQQLDRDEQERPSLSPKGINGLHQAQELAMERFSHLNPFQERKIKRILLAYTKSKADFYYCHGMVEICVVLSTFLTEEDAFWAFRLLLEVLLPKYHEESILDFHVDCLVLQELLDRQDPALCAHFTDMGVTIQLLCTKWFFSFFAESMPFDLVCRLYDVLLVDICCKKLSSKIIFATSMAIFLYLSQMLVEVQDPSVMIEIICEFCATTLRDYSVAESFVDLILFLHDQLSETEVIAMRAKYKEQVERENAANGMASLPAKAKRSKTRRSHSIKLIIQWKEDGDAASPPAVAPLAPPTDNPTPKPSITRDRPPPIETDTISDEQVEVEIVTTPTERQMLEKLGEGITKINRRRSRSSSLRNLMLYPGEGSMSGGSRRTLSGASSTVTSPRSRLADEQPPREEDEQTEREHSWEEQARVRNPAVVIHMSMQGVPEEHRCWVWPILLNQIEPPKNLPTKQELLNDLHEEELDREVIKAIENDIARTRNLREDQYPSMKRVLEAFARRNRRVGYCQGMNEILAALLRHLEERDALLALVLLIEQILPSYHVDSMIGLHTDCAVMNTLVKQNDIEVHTNLQNVGLNMEILCTKWLVTCFLTSLPSFCGMKILDMMFARTPERKAASRVLLGVGIAIFFTLRSALLEAKDAGEILMAINEYFAQEMTKTNAEMDRFLAVCGGVIQQLRPEIVEEFRLVHKDEVMERFAAFEARKIEMRQQMEEAKLTQQRKKAGGAPASPPKSDSAPPSIGSASKSAATGTKKHGGIFSKPLRGSASGKTGAAASSGATDMFYQRVDVIEANRSFSEDLAKMEEQLEDLAELFCRGKIDDKEHSCIKAQIVRKWCKGMNSPQSAMIRVRHVKATFGDSTAAKDAPLKLSLTSTMSCPPDFEGENRKSSSSLYGRMKKVKRSAIAIFKSTFE
ncbi:TPA: hypothetical protein N0F65_006437 [Lagenidium giganteum]|uniref:Rab-GAP TBC domain-containing protein n=1 Tax=Lagenidium giganteum TaxID=4803 RepID=A0AAV2Z0R3_9STRA|nr:TPA: hypothetical protein N0F65_006437 [Lagenidium giganteum]